MSRCESISGKVYRTLTISESQQKHVTGKRRHQELKKPSFWSRGHIIIIRQTGDTIKIIIASKKDFKDLVSLMSQFSQAQMTVR